MGIVLNLLSWYMHWCVYLFCFVVCVCVCVCVRARLCVCVWACAPICTFLVGREEGREEGREREGEREGERERERCWKYTQIKAVAAEAKETWIKRDLGQSPHCSTAQCLPFNSISFVQCVWTKDIYRPNAQDSLDCLWEGSVETSPPKGRNQELVLKQRGSRLCLASPLGHLEILRLNHN